MESLKCSFLRLGRYKEATLYLKEYLKLCARSYKLGVAPSIGSSLTKKGCSNFSNYIGRYTQQVTTKNELWQCYLELLNAQIQSKCHFDALKTCEKIKFFNLHSMNASDVLTSLESKGYKNFLPNTAFSNFEAKQEFKNVPINTDFTEWVVLVARFWTEKVVMFKAFEDREMFQKWSGTNQFVAVPMLIIMDLMNLDQGLLYRWTEHVADFIFSNSNWGREQGPPNYTLGVYFLDHDLL